MIELYLLEQLLAFSEYGTLSAASKHLHISQPALTHSMQKLEELMEVKLFERQRNRITLNETGKMAVEYGKKVLDQEKEMIEQIRLFDKSSRTITLGACAPVPVWDMVPLLSQIYSGLTISSEIRNRDEELLEGLEKNKYQLVILHEKPSNGEIYVQAYGKERLFLSVPEGHPLAERSEIYLSDIDGQNLLLYTEIGFWYELCRQKLPNAHFLMMSEHDAFGEVAGSGAFPSFVSDVLMRRDPNNSLMEKKIIPILDNEVNVTYYCVCRYSDRKKFEPLYRRLGSYKI